MWRSAEASTCGVATRVVEGGNQCECGSLWVVAVPKDSEATTAAFFRLHTAPHLLKEVGSSSTTPCRWRTAVQLPCLSLAPLAEHQRLAQLPAKLHVAVQPVEGEAQLGLQATGGALAACRPAEGRLADRSSLLFEKKISWSSAALLAPTPPQP